MAMPAADVKSLRDRTNAPMMECKAALTEAGGDMDKAIDLLRKKHAGLRASRGERETAEGRVATYISPDQKVGAILEMRCESAPVAKQEHFVQLANEAARAVAEQKPASPEALLALAVDKSGKTVNDRIGEVYALLREQMKPHRFVRLEGLIGSYEHHDGSVGVLLQVEGAKADPQVLRDVCMH